MIGYSQKLPVRHRLCEVAVTRMRIQSLISKEQFRFQSSNLKFVAVSSRSIKEGELIRTNLAYVRIIRKEG